MTAIQPDSHDIDTMRSGVLPLDHDTACTCGDQPIAAQGNATTVPIQIPAVAERGPLVTPNTIRAVTSYMDAPWPGNTVNFNISGRPGSTKAKCGVLVTFDRAPNAIHPKAASMSKEYAIELHPSIATLLETDSPNEGGDWIFKIKPVHDCTGDAYAFPYKIPFANNEVLPVILGVGEASGTPMYLTNGQSAGIVINGNGDLKNCKLEFAASGGWTLPGGAASKVVSMNGQLTVTETVVVNFPVLNQPGFLPGSSSPAYLSVKPLSGCALNHPYEGNMLKATYSVWNSLQ